jgi:hypothetical protein
MKGERVSGVGQEGGEMIREWTAMGLKVKLPRGETCEKCD